MYVFAGRSQMSAALFNAHADPSKARAISAGTNPSTTGVHPVCVNVMQVRCFHDPKLVVLAALAALDNTWVIEEYGMHIHDLFSLNRISCQVCTCRNWAST